MHVSPANTFNTFNIFNTVNVPCIDEDSGEQRVDNSGKNVTQKVIVTDINKHLSYKAERIKKWMSREGLENERK